MYTKSAQTPFTIPKHSNMFADTTEPGTPDSVCAAIEYDDTSCETNIDFDASIRIMSELEDEFPYNEENHICFEDDLERFLNPEEHEKYRRFLREMIANEALDAYKEKNGYKIRVDKSLEDFFQIHFTKQDCQSCSKGSGYFVMSQDGMHIIRSAKGYDLLNQLKNLTYYKGKNYYITSNSYLRPKIRNMGQIYGLHNIVVDCDAHNSGINFSQLKEYAIDTKNFIMEHWEEFSSAVPRPNSVVLTGRGIQLWWSFKPIKFEYCDCFDYLANYTSEIVSEVLEKAPMGYLFEVDSGASANKAGYFRLPGTINRKTGTFAEVQVFDTTIHDMFKVKKRAYQEFKKNHPIDNLRSTIRIATVKNMSADSFSEYAKRRTLSLHVLLVLRGFDMPHMRDYFLWLYHNDARKYMGDQNALNATIALAGMLKNPLSARDVAHIIQGTMNASNEYCENGGYAIRNVKIIKLLGITESEQNIIGLHPAKTSAESRPNKTRDAEAHKRKMMKFARYYCALTYGGNDQTGKPPKNKEICAKFSISNTTLIKCRKEREVYMSWAETEEGKESIKIFQAMQEGTLLEQTSNVDVQTTKRKLAETISRYNETHKTNIINPANYDINIYVLSQIDTETTTSAAARTDRSCKAKSWDTSGGYEQIAFARTLITFDDRTFGACNCTSGNASCPATSAISWKEICTEPLDFQIVPS